MSVNWVQTTENVSELRADLGRVVVHRKEGCITSVDKDFQTKVFGIKDYDEARKWVLERSGFNGVD